jgi:hypothetical protein
MLVWILWVPLFLTLEGTYFRTLSLWGRFPKIVIMIKIRWYYHRFRFFQYFGLYVIKTFKIMFTGCPKLKHLQLAYVYFSPKNVKCLCRGLTNTSHLQSLGLDFFGDFEKNIEENNNKLLLASIPPSLKVNLCCNIYFVVSCNIYYLLIFKILVNKLERKKKSN